MIVSAKCTFKLSQFLKNRGSSIENIGQLSKFKQHAVDESLGRVYTILSSLSKKQCFHM